jgi:hypothetical protein
MFKIAMTRILLPAAIALAFMQTGFGKGYSPPGLLPGIESKLQACRLTIEQRGLGSVESMHTVQRNGTRYYVFVTHDRAGRNRLVACAAESGEIVQTVGLDLI